MREIADELGRAPSTIWEWLHRHGIETRQANDQKTHPSYSTNSAGYAYFHSQHGDERAHVAVHELVAIADGADPHRVFSDDTHCHHRLGVPAGFDINVHIDIPGNILVLDADEHLSDHASGECEHEDIEVILD